MRILILHRVPYYKIDYARGIDHARYDVTYIGTSTALSDIPADLRCRKIVRLGIEKTSVEVLKAVLKEDAFDRVISLSEYELIDAAEVREALGVSGASIEAVKKVRDKLIMKKAVAASGLEVPRNFSCADFLEVGKQVPWSGRTVLKPIDGASSENVVTFSSPKIAAEAIRKKILPIASFDPRFFEVEEFLEGDILHIDGLVHEGNFLTVRSSRYIGTFLEYANGKPLGSIQFPISQSLKDWALRCLSAVGISTGAFHLEAIESSEGPVFLEVGARVGGADVVDSYELATGVHLPSCELQLLTAETPIIPLTIEPSRYFGWFVFPGHHYSFERGRVMGSKDFRTQDYVVRWNELLPSQRLPRKITYQSREVPIAGIIGAASSEELDLFLHRVFENIKVIDSKTLYRNIAINGASEQKAMRSSS